MPSDPAESLAGLGQAADQELTFGGRRIEGERGPVGAGGLGVAAQPAQQVGPAPGETDWAQIAALYAALASHEPTPVVHANQAVAVAMAEGPAAGLAILDGLDADGQTEGWHLLHACRADLLRRLGRTAEARDAYRAALALDPPPAELQFLTGRLSELLAPSAKG